MSVTERAELHARVEKLKVDCGVVFLECQRIRALKVGFKIQNAFAEIQQADEAFELTDIG